MRRLGRCRRCRRYIDKRALACPFCESDAELRALGTAPHPAHAALGRSLYGMLVLGTLGGCGAPTTVAQITMAPMDTDRDGIADADDQCRDVAEDVDGVEDDDGCPDLEDTDGDGIWDGDDRCETDAEDPDGFEDHDGCPDLDNDSDGIVDADDQCPMEQEIINGITDLDGCPDADGGRKIPVYGQSRISIKETIAFDVGSAEIPKSHAELLEDLAEVIRNNPEIGRVSIEGHADTRERQRAKRRDRLSLKRAEAVRDALLERGVEPERLVVVGHGDAEPLAPSDNADGRARNRRVAFELPDQ